LKSVVRKTIWHIVKFMLSIRCSLQLFSKEEELMHIETQQNDNVLQEDTMRMEGKHFTAISLNFMSWNCPSLKD